MMNLTPFTMSVQANAPSLPTACSVRMPPVLDRQAVTMLDRDMMR